MAIYHLEAKVVSRGAGRSAVAASAYLSCSRLYNDYDGIQHDYTKKQGLVWQQVFLPEYAPQEWKDREQLWNAVEEVETAKDSRLAREFVVALPIELSREEQIELLQEFIREQFVSDGMCADAAIHDTDGHNPHAHILLTVRPLDERGKWQYKTEKEYLCMKNGEERGFTAAEFKTAQADGCPLLISVFFSAPLAKQKETRYNMTERTESVIFKEAWAWLLPITRLSSSARRC